jgi:DNA helicase HerA-like ATPase
MTIEEFILARVAEDEHYARLADEVEDDWQDVVQPITNALTQARPQEVWSKRYGHAFQHIARHDPARVLAECEAKRRILDRAANDIAAADAKAPDQITRSFDAGAAHEAYNVLLDLVRVWADHPDFREEWR